MKCKCTNNFYQLWTGKASIVINSLLSCALHQRLIFLTKETYSLSYSYIEYKMVQEYWVKLHFPNPRQFSPMVCETPRSSSRPGPSPAPRLPGRASCSQTRSTRRHLLLLRRCTPDFRLVWNDVDSTYWHRHQGRHPPPANIPDRATFDLLKLRSGFNRSNGKNVSDDNHRRGWWQQWPWCYSSGWPRPRGLPCWTSWDLGLGVGVLSCLIQQPIKCDLIFDDMSIHDPQLHPWHL